MIQAVDRREVLEVLVKARARIDKPQKWCAYWFCSEDYKRLGADGAVWECADPAGPLAKAACHALASHSGMNELWGDWERVTYVVTHKAVMAMFDGAIQELEVKP